MEEKVKMVRRITELSGKEENWLGKIGGKKGEIGQMDKGEPKVQYVEI